MPEPIVSRELPHASNPDADAVDVASEASFPASDAPSWTGVTGTGPPPECAHEPCEETPPGGESRPPATAK